MCLCTYLPKTILPLKAEIKNLRNLKEINKFEFNNNYINNEKY